MMQIENVCASYKTISGLVPAVENVSFTIHDEEIFGIAGESGCGKSTLLKLLYDLVQFPLELTGGRVVLRKKRADGKEDVFASGAIRDAWWNAVSYVPQAAMSVLNPVYRVREQFYEVIRRHNRQDDKKAMNLRLEKYMQELSLPKETLDAYPHQLSGGMRQRIVIAMATFLQPSLILADEPTTALDVVVQRNILMMLMELQQRMRNTLVVVSHDMGVHYQITNRMGIMYAGGMVELGNTEDIFTAPLHPYTRMLIGALPRLGDKRPKEGIPGAPPSLRMPPPGCRFAPRCPHAESRCSNAVPPLQEITEGRFAACFLLTPEQQCAQNK